MKKLVLEIEEKYNIKIKSIKVLQGGWLNKKYIIEVDDKYYVLKEFSLNKFPNGYLKTLKETLYIQNSLKKNKLLVPSVLENSNNDLLTNLSNGEYYFIQEFIKGHSKNADELSLNEIESIGENLAKLHLLMQNIDRKKFDNDFMHYKNINDLKIELQQKKNQINNATPEKYINCIILHSDIIKNIEETKMLEKQTIQLIHGDYTPDNILLLNDRVNGIVDFELVRINTRLQDFGRIMLSVAFKNDNFDLQKVKALMTGYNKYIKIDDEEINDSLKVVWINESNIWLQERYYRNYNPPKVQKFISEMEWITNNWFNINVLKKETMEYGRVKKK